jgi:pilus assembly protein Flp/PilA
MNTPILKAIENVLALIRREDGQDLVEYALLISVIAFAATAGMSSIATSVNQIFVGLGTAFANATS